jgi:hypothetical protein
VYLQYWPVTEWPTIKQDVKMWPQTIQHYYYPIIITLTQTSIYFTPQSTYNTISTWPKWPTDGNLLLTKILSILW